MTGCPHSDCSCSTRCLRSHCPADRVAAFDRVLQRARQREEPTPALRLVTDPELVPTRCTGSYVCPCVECVGDRQERRELVPERVAVLQPWESRPSRRRAA